MGVAWAEVRGADENLCRIGQLELGGGFRIVRFFLVTVGG